MLRIPALGTVPWTPGLGRVSTGYEAQNSLLSALLKQLQALVIESTTQQQLAKIAAAAATTIAEHDTITNTVLTHSDNCQARPYARVRNAT